MGAPRLEGGCEVIEKQEISEMARELSLDLHVVEKDYVLGWLLAGISAERKEAVIKKMLPTLMVDYAPGHEEIPKLPSGGYFHLVWLMSV